MSNTTCGTGTDVNLTRMSLAVIDEFFDVCVTIFFRTDKDYVGVKVNCTDLSNIFICNICIDFIVARELRDMMIV